jgi:hypothetical protein
LKYFLRFGLTFLLSVLSLVDLGYSVEAFVSDRDNGYPVFIAANVVKVATFLLAFGLQVTTLPT